MGIVSRMARPRAARELSYYSPAHDHWYEGEKFFNVGPTAAGVTVSSETAMRLITVQNCVRMRASTLSRLPCHVIEKIGKNRRRATDFSLYGLLHDQPNEWMTAPEFWSMAEAHVSLTGNFCAYKMETSRGVFSLIPIKTGMVRKVEHNPDYSLTYKIHFQKPGNSISGETIDVHQRKIFHLRGLTIDGIWGVNPIEYARETVGLGMAGTNFAGRWFSKGLHPSAVIEHPQVLNAPAFAQRKKDLQERYEGLGKTHEFMLIDEAMKIQFPQIKLVDQQFLELMKLSDAQIAGLFRVPLMLINGGDKEPTYASAEQFMLFYQMFSIDAPVYEAAIKRDLMSIEERKKYYAKFSVEGLLRGSMKDRAEFYQTLINCEMMNPNEGREHEDMNPYEGGNEYRTRTSSMKQQPAKTAEGGK